VKIVLNGEERDCPEALALPALLAELRVTPDRVAVMVNDAVVPRARRGGCVLRNGDRVEVLAFAGGG
jgi:thiamine biosynthesis protein ThiS